MLLERAEHAGAAHREDARAGDRAPRHAAGVCARATAALEADFCIVATGARNPLREVGTRVDAPQDTMMRARLLRARRRRSTSTFSFCRSSKATSGCFRAAGICRWASAARANRRKRCARAWKHTWHERGISVKDATFYSHMLPSLETPGWSKNRVVGRRLDGGGRRGRAGGSDHRRRPVLRDALRRSGEPGGPGRCARASPTSRTPTARCCAREFALDLEFGATLAKRVFLGRFLFSTVPARMVQFMRRSPRFRDLMQDLFAGTQPYLELEGPPAAKPERHAAGSAHESLPAARDAETRARL